MLEGGVEEGSVIVGRRGASLFRLPVTRQDRRVIFTETCDVTAQEGHLVISTLGEGEEPKRTTRTNKVPTQIESLPRLVCAKI